MSIVAIWFLQVVTGLASPFWRLVIRLVLRSEPQLLNFGLRDGPSQNGIPNFGLRDGPSQNGIPNFGLRAETVLKFGQKGSDRGPITRRA